MISALSRYTDSVQSKIAARPWQQTLDDVRNGPPLWSPTRIGRIDRLINTTEFFVHHEDVRRARDGWQPRSLDNALIDDLRGALTRMATLFTRSAPAGITLVPDDGSPTVDAHDGAPMVAVMGAIGELVLWVFGRQQHAEVTYAGEPEAIDALVNASFGI